MKINPDDFSKYLKCVSYKEHGDPYEQKFGDLLSEYFPNCEHFWRIFVVPFTERIEGYPSTIAAKYNTRAKINPDIEDIANAHYSMFLNLVFAHIHLDEKMQSSLENIYTHLGSVCDLVEMVIEKWYFLYIKLKENETQALSELSRDEFLRKMGILYDEKFEKWQEYYLKWGKSPIIKPFPVSDALVKYFGETNQVRKEYSTQSENIRHIRNIIVHDVKVARIITKDKETLIPKPKVILNYRSWRKVAAVIGNQAVITRDFEEQYKQAKEDIESLETILNIMWETLIHDINCEFYSTEKTTLRDMFEIEFSLAETIVTEINSDITKDSSKNIIPSGTYSGGTAVFPSFSDHKDPK